MASRAIGSRLTSPPLERNSLCRIVQQMKSWGKAAGGGLRKAEKVMKNLRFSTFCTTFSCLFSGLFRLSFLGRDGQAVDAAVGCGDIKEL